MWHKVPLFSQHSLHRTASVAADFYILILDIHISIHSPFTEELIYTQTLTIILYWTAAHSLYSQLLNSATWINRQSVSSYSTPVAPRSLFQETEYVYNCHWRDKMFSSCPVLNLKITNMMFVNLNVDFASQESCNLECRTTAQHMTEKV